jgi:hypothetical protein
MYNGPSFADGWTPQRNTFLEIFLHLFPLEFFTNVIIEATSNALFAADSARTSLGEMLRYLGMWMLMSCYMKSPGYFWQSAAQMASDGAEDKENDTPSFTFNHYMSRWRFVAITSALRFTSSAPPTFRDKYWEVWDMIAAWNAHMAKIFVAECGWFAWTSKCPSGITNGLVLGGCFAHANPTPSGTNTTQRAVDCWAFCFQWSCSRGRITLHRSRRLVFILCETKR